MPRLTSSADAIAIFKPFTHLYNAIYYVYCQDVTQFVNITALVLGEYVLDLGIGST
jgi:hypothetical protein